MKRLVVAAFLLFAATDALVAQQPDANSANAPRRKTSIKVTGAYRLRFQSLSNRMEVLQMPDGKIKFHILALWISSYHRDNVHNGEVQGIAELHDRTAVYQAEHCKISIEFAARRAIVRQFDDQGDCDFGVNVTATGTYRKTDNRKPKFDF